MKKYPFVEAFKATVNLKYYGRYTLAKHAETTYTWILKIITVYFVGDVLPFS